MCYVCDTKRAAERAVETDDGATEAVALFGACLLASLDRYDDLTAIFATLATTLGMIKGYEVKYGRELPAPSGEFSEYMTAALALRDRQVGEVH